jgi:hypothetical protein
MPTVDTTLVTGFSTTLAQALKSDWSDTTITLSSTTWLVNWNWVMLMGTGDSKEWISFTWTSWSTITGCTRGFNKNATSLSDTTASNKKNHAVWTTVRLVAHSITLNNYPELDDDNAWTWTNTFTSTTKASLIWQNLTTTQRDALTWVANWSWIYNTTLWQTQWYEWWTWVSNAAWWSVADASTTVAWKVEIATTAESIAGTATWWTWAILTPVALDVIKNERSWVFVYYWLSTWWDTYVCTSNTPTVPALTAYTTWMKVRFKADAANTWACSINIDTLWAKSIKTKAWNDPMDNAILANQFVELIYDWTNMVLQQDIPASETDSWVVELATLAEFDAWVDTTRYVNCYQAKQLNPIAWTSSTIFTANTERTWTDTTYTKKKEASILNTWTYTTSFEMVADWWWTSYWRIYKNWVAVWTEWTNVTWVYAAYTDNLSFSKWDLCQVYVKRSWWANYFIKNFNCKCDLWLWTVITD